MTKYTAQERKLLVKSFKKVLKVLPGLRGTRGHLCRSPFICDNIGLEVEDPLSRWLARILIKDRIGYSFSIEEWLSNQSEQIAKEVEHDRLHNQSYKIQAYRKAWLQKLIEEFSA